MPHGKNSQLCLICKILTFMKCNILLVERLKDTPTTTVDSHWLPVEQWTGPSKSLHISRSRYSNPKHKTKQKQEHILEEMKINNMLSCYTHPNWTNKYFIAHNGQNMFISCCLGPRDPWIVSFIHQPLDKIDSTLAVCWAQGSKTQAA